MSYRTRNADEEEGMEARVGGDAVLWHVAETFAISPVRNMSEHETGTESMDEEGRRMNEKCLRRWTGVMGIPP